jgi:hypothetical protein
MGRNVTLRNPQSIVTSHHSNFALIHVKGQTTDWKTYEEKGKVIFLFPKGLRTALGPRNLLFHRYWGAFPWVKRSEYEAYQLAPCTSSVDVSVSEIIPKLSSYASWLARALLTESSLNAKTVQSLQDSWHIFTVEVAAVTPELLTGVYTDLEYRFNVVWVVNGFCIELKC